jgi:hypothetical protein
MRANGGLVNFDLGSVADDKLKDAAMTYEIQSGDIIYIPFGWFHRVDHRGQYINIATFWCFAEFLEKKLKVLKSKIPESDFRALFKSTLRLKYWRSRGAMLGFH